MSKYVGCPIGGPEIEMLSHIQRYIASKESRARIMGV